MSTETLPDQPRPRNVRARRRDQQIRRFVRGLRSIAPHVDEPQFAPLLRSYAMITMMIERSYATLRARELISPKSDELRSSIDVLGRLIGQQSKLAAALHLTPATLRALRHKRADLAAALVTIEDAEVSR